MRTCVQAYSSRQLNRHWSSAPRTNATPCLPLVYPPQSTPEQSAGRLRAHVVKGDVRATLRPHGGCGGMWLRADWVDTLLPALLNTCWRLARLVGSACPRLTVSLRRAACSRLGF